MMLKKGGRSSPGGGGGKVRGEFEVEMKEEYQLITQFRHHAELIMAKQAQFVKIWRLRIGAIYLLLNFTKGASTSTVIALPSVFDMKMRIKPKIYHSQNNREALNVVNILRKDYVRMLITKLPNTFLKHKFATFFGVKSEKHQETEGNDEKRTFRKYRESMTKKLTKTKHNRMAIEQFTLREEEEDES